METQPDKPEAQNDSSAAKTTLVILLVCGAILGCQGQANKDMSKRITRLEDRLNAAGIADIKKAR